MGIKNSSHRYHINLRKRKQILADLKNSGPCLPSILLSIEIKTGIPSGRNHRKHFKRMMEKGEAQLVPMFESKRFNCKTGGDMLNSSANPVSVYFLKNK
jgi:hypothetical protein